MQCTVEIQIAAEQLKELRNRRPFIEVLLETLMEQREKIGYSIQDYHSREKVRVVDFTNTSTLDNSNFRAVVRYTLEQFSICSAIDSKDYTSMDLTIRYSEGSEVLTIIGEYMPEP